MSFDEIYSWVKDLPVVDWHNHLDLDWIAADRPLGSLYEVWVKADPYKHRLMRICGEPERVITGDASEGEKWAAWMRTLPKAVGTPVFAWAQMETAFLGLDTAAYLHGVGDNVSLAAWSPSKLLTAFKVEWLSPCISSSDISAWDNGRPRPLDACQNWDNGRPRPLQFQLQWTAPEVRIFPQACSAPSAHFSHTLSAGSVHRRNLPHIGQGSTLVFVTFRLADSLPEAGLAEFRATKEEWLRQHPEPWDSDTQFEYRCEIAERIDKWLDAGHGSCLLADERCRQIVEDSLEYFNGERTTDEDVRCPRAGQRSTDEDVRCPRYVLHSYVVMPNHVHVLFEPLKGDDLPKIVQGWKSVSARRIHAACGTQGAVWKEEYYDRLIRNAEHYQNTLAYIVKNGNAARGLARSKAGQRATDEDVRCPRVGQRATDEDVRCPSVAPSLRMNAGDVVTSEDLIRFQAAGCRVVDISVDDTALLDTAFESLSVVASYAAAHGWTMLLHLGALRETSARLRAAAGPAGGFAGMRAPGDPADVARFLNRLEGTGIATDEDVRCPRAGQRSTDEDVRCPRAGQRSTDEDVRCPRVSNALPRTILLSLNPEAHAQLAVLAGSFNGEGLPGKVQLGPAWWWCDHGEGIRDVLEKNAAYGVLSTFVGMTTDSRSLLSFVRHDYFRRVFARWLAAKVAAGEYPDDAALLRPLAENVCYRNARNMITDNCLTQTTQTIK